MIRLSVFYPKGDDITFDHDYYASSHVPMCAAAWGVDGEIDRGVDGPNVAAVHFKFDSLEAMQTAVSSPKMGEILGDVPNYTNATPVMQVSETS
jgi:uncharacterized protein (TIGR02118 family)